jgi:hypothetical protein
VGALGPGFGRTDNGKRLSMFLGNAHVSMDG